MINTINTRRARPMARQPDSTLSPVRDTASPIVQPLTDQAIATMRQSKTAMVVQLLQRSDGASLDELVRATGWLAHTTRAAMTGLKKKGHLIERRKVDGVSKYFIVKSG